MVSTPKAVRVAFKQTCAGLEAYNIYNVLCPAAATGADLTAIATVFKAWWDNNYRVEVSTQVTFNGMELTALDGPGAPVLSYTNITNLTGSSGSGTYPPQVAMVIALRTGLSGRSYRGRIYHPFLNLGYAATGGLINAGSVVTLRNVWENLRTRLVTAGYQLCVVSMYSGVDSSGNKIPRLVGLATPVSAIAVGNRIDTQRRRLPTENRA